MDPNIFREYDIRGIVGTQLTDGVVLQLGRAIGTFFGINDARRIAVGYDARESSPGFCELITRGLNAAGRDVVLIGRVPTPVLYYAVFTQDVDGGVMITGSHNPPDHNGFKICLGRDALFGEQIQEIRRHVSDDVASGSGSIESTDLMDEYLASLGERISVGSRRIKTVIDAGNGMGGVTAVPLYRKLGVDVIELYTMPDPTFPHHHPDPTVEANLVALIETVKSDQADVGIAFDGDGDRVGVVDETGRIIWGDELTALFSRAVLRDRPASTIIGEVKCSQTLFDDIKAHGGKPLMWRAGHSLIKAKMKETGAVLAGEMSGHIFFSDRFYGFDDATYAGARLLEILSHSDVPLSVMLADIPKMFSTPEIRIECPEDIKVTAVEHIINAFSPTHRVTTIDGARIVFEKGWGLVRASNTQALLVLRFEAESEVALADIRRSVESALAEVLGSQRI